MKQAFDIIPLAAAKTKPGINLEQNVHSHTFVFARVLYHSITTQHSQRDTQSASHKTTTTTPNTIQSRATDKTQAEGAVEEAAVAPPPPCRVSTFLVGKRPVKVCKKLALSVCDDMRLPLRSMAYGWGWMEGWQQISVKDRSVWCNLLVR